MSGAVRFTRIDVRQMPGFPRGGLAVDDLAQGINVVYGPNASGKTTLARAMQRLLRPQANGHQTDSLTAGLVVAGQSFDFDYHLGRLVCRSGGHEVPVPALAPAEVGERYVLALHELIQQEDDQDIVQQILREAAGGYDVAAAALELGFDRNRPSARSIKPVRDFDHAASVRNAAEEKLLAIDRDAKQLADRERQRAAAHQAQLRQTTIENALDALAKQEQLVAAQGAVAAFPAAMSKLVGDEWQQLTDLKGKVNGLRGKLAVETKTLDDAQRVVAATGLPPDGVLTELVGTLQNRCETLRASDAEISRLKSELAGVKGELDNALVQLGAGVSPQQAKALDAATLDKLFKFVRQVEDQRLEGEASAHVANWLSAVSPTPASQAPDTLRDGIMLLQQWLAEQRLTPRRAPMKWGWLVAAGITAAVAVAMAFVHVSWLLLLLPASGLALWPFLRPTSRAVQPMVQEIPTQWAGLGLPPPTAWTPAEVQVTLRRLQQELATAQLDQEKCIRFADIQERCGKYKKLQPQIDRVRQEWRDKLGLEINVEDARMYLLAAAILAAQAAGAHVVAAEAKITTARQHYDEILATINAELAPYSTVPATDVDQASALIRSLDQRRQVHREALARYESAEDNIREYNRQIVKLESDRITLFTRLGLTVDNELALQQWTQRFPQYQQACENHHLALRDAGTAAAKMAGDEDLLQRTREALQTELDQCCVLAQNLKDLDEKLGDIRGRVRRAKEETALEAALAAESACLDELRAARDKDGAVLVGNLLSSYLTRQQREVCQPHVLSRAGELFARITHGRYRLLVEAGDPPGFRAVDTSLGREQNLDELSSGTRLQLMLSVRVAFVEQQEQGLKLPLIFDETLGNSDEQRATKIIEAAVEIARGGRQVFYFTAQHDELGKWRRVLRESTDVAHCEFDLARLRGFSEAEHAPQICEHEPARTTLIPAPDGDDWRAYGRRLRVSPLDRRAHIGGVHLWYVLDDVHELHRLITRDINKWGQLQTLVEIGSAEGLTRDSPVIRRATAAAQLLEQLLRLWRQGRGEPVDRTVLEASSAVSGAFIDEVSQLAESLGGDARRLIEELRAGHVRRFRAAQSDALEGYLIERGCLDDQPVLDAAVIRESVAPLVFANCENGLLSREHVDQLLSLVIADAPAEGGT